MTTTTSTTLATPIGRLRLSGDEDSLRAIEFGARPRASEPVPAALREAARQLEAYFAGRLRTFELPLAPEGTAFQKRVFRALRAIPYGETRSYAELARRLAAPRAARAVGAASGRNPLPIVIPCHRLIASDGGLGGYAAGSRVKRLLLELEGVP